MFPIVLTLDGIVTEVILLFFLKEPSLIYVTPFGIVTLPFADFPSIKILLTTTSGSAVLLASSHGVFSNASSRTVVTLLGILILTSFSQP